jgi:hypothetical protein
MVVSLKVRLMLLGVIVVGGAVVAGGIYFGGSGELYVVNDGQRVELSIDGKVVPAATSSKAHVKFDAPQGQHKVTLKNLESGESRSFDVNVSSGFTELVLPMDEDQCFARFDVTKFMYEGTFNKSANKPTISNRFEASKPFELPSSSYFSVESLPKKLKKRSKAYLMRAVPCEALRRPDPELMEVAGFDL